MYKKISGIALALMLSVSNFVNAENWIETTTELGRFSDEYYLSEAELSKQFHTFYTEYGYKYEYDADSIRQDKANKIVYATIRHRSNTSKNISCENMVFYFDRDPRKCKAVSVKQITHYGNGTTKTYNNQLTWYLNYGFLKSPYNPFYRGYTWWQDFGYFVDMPNQDGTPYVEPKRLNLTWATSTEKFGVFYDAKSVKAKSNKINANIYLWYPGANRYQKLISTLNYDTNQWEIKETVTRRLSDNTVTEHAKTTSTEKIAPLEFTSNYEGKVVSEYFKKFLKK